MLVLSRRSHEGVTVYDAAGAPIGCVTVTEIRGDKVRLGFDFSQEFKIKRNELIGEPNRGKENK